MIHLLDSLYPVLAQRGSSSGGSGLEMLPCCICVGIPFAVVGVLWILTALGMWKVFEKAGEPGWAGLVPVYNWMVAARIAGRPEWHGLMVLCSVLHLPGQIVAIVFMVMIGMDVARSFGKEQGFGVGLGFPLVAPIFWMILGFSDATYGGPVYEEPGGYRRRRRDYDDEGDDGDRPRRRRARADNYDDDRRSRRRENDEDDRRPRRRDEDEDDRRSRRREEGYDPDHPARRPDDERDIRRP